MLIIRPSYVIHHLSIVQLMVFVIILFLLLQKIGKSLFFQVAGIIILVKIIIK